MIKLHFEAYTRPISILFFLFLVALLSTAKKVLNDLNASKQNKMMMDFKQQCVFSSAELGSLTNKLFNSFFSFVRKGRGTMHIS